MHDPHHTYIISMPRTVAPGIGAAPALLGPRSKSSLLVASLLLSPGLNSMSLALTSTWIRCLNISRSTRAGSLRLTVCPYYALFLKKYFDFLHPDSVKRETCYSSPHEMMSIETFVNNLKDEGKIQAILTCPTSSTLQPSLVP